MLGGPHLLECNNPPIANLEKDKKRYHETEMISFKEINVIDLDSNVKNNIMKWMLEV